MISGLILSVGIAAGIWGIIWFALDHGAEAPCWMLVFAGVCLITGLVMP